MMYNEITSICKNIVIFDDMDDALQSKATHIRVIFSQNYQKDLPEGWELLAKIPYLELDLRFSEKLNIEKTLMQLATLKNLRGLFLPYIESKTVHKEIGLFVELESLKLTYQWTKTLPSEFENLKNLRCLILSCRGMEGFPKQLQSLTKLEYLEMEENHLKKISKKFCNVMKNNLKTLVFKKCYFKL